METGAALSFKTGDFTSAASSRHALLATCHGCTVCVATAATQPTTLTHMDLHLQCSIPMIERRVMSSCHLIGFCSADHKGLCSTSGGGCR